MSPHGCCGPCTMSHPLSPVACSGAAALYQYFSRTCGRHEQSETCQYKTNLPAPVPDCRYARIDLLPMGHLVLAKAVHPPPPFPRPLAAVLWLASLVNGDTRKQASRRECLLVRTDMILPPLGQRDHNTQHSTLAFVFRYEAFPIHVFQPPH